ncbi:M20/M25/M40 family metallo-hydrolase [Salegentibacter sp. JZCK2]|uniref:M20/M25/M40 family metallo-hydrolase n=1 Tax=Salegentibacter tibetensis TaxID=2873600 RepID=UPI001CCF75A9|nr:M20/M25/M40 family metallo-hydrolase [Salegentibacter tibetensis]MBZ9730078.1 M20/M25/M40 family metallo-hydrolase [Salegentibacter tibetensis]
MKYQGIFLLFFITISIQAQKISSEEEEMLNFLKEKEQEQINFLEKTVNINSGTLNLAGVREVGMVYKEELDDLGFETRWISMPDSLNRAGHLFAELNGGNEKTILLIGHLDSVFEEDHEFQSFSRSGKSAAGPAANDMKGGNAVIIFALKALQAAGELEGKNIIVAFTGDEEKPGHPLSVSRYDLIEAAKKADIALGFETASGMNYATIARRGSSGWNLKVNGKQAHSSGIFSENTGAGAIFEAARILNSFYSYIRGDELLSFNPGVILGGTNVDYNPSKSMGTAFGKTNVVASELEVYGGLRFISEEQKEETRNKMREIVKNNLPHTSAAISFTDSYPAMEPTKGNIKLLEVLDEISQDLGYGKVEAYDPGRRGAADISFIAEYVDGLDGLGVMGSGAHSPSETINLETFIPLTERAALLIHRLSSN